MTEELEDTCSSIREKNTGIKEILGAGACCIGTARQLVHTARQIKYEARYGEGRNMGGWEGREERRKEDEEGGRETIGSRESLGRAS